MRHPSRVLRILLLAGLPFGAAAALPAPALAQGNGNVWDWRAHEESQGTVQSRERAAGVQPSPGQQQRLNNEVEQLDRQLTGQPAGPNPRQPARPTR